MVVQVDYIVQLLHILNTPDRGHIVILKKKSKGKWRAGYKTLAHGLGGNTSNLSFGAQLHHILGGLVGKHVERKLHHIVQTAKDSLTGKVGILRDESGKTNDTLLLASVKLVVEPVGRFVCWNLVQSVQHVDVNPSCVKIQKTLIKIPPQVRHALGIRL